MNCKNMKKIGFFVLCGALVVSGFQFMQNASATDEYYGDTFYVLDENGIPQNIEPTKEDIGKLEELNNGDYQVVTTMGNEDHVLGTFDSFEEASNVYEEKTQSVNKFSRARSKRSVENVMIVSDDNIIQSKNDIIGIVQFKREVVNGYVANINYTEVDTKRAGYLNPSSIADAAYIRTDGNYTICKMGGVEIRVPTSKIKDIVPYDEYDKLSYYTVSNGYLIHYFSYYSSANKISMSSTRVGYKPSYLSNGVKYYSYDGHYFYKDFKDMIEDYRNGNYNQSINKNSPYYNYYQYLSLRSKTNLTASQFNTRVNSVASNPSSSRMYNKGQSFINAQNTYGINANMIFGVAANESAYGTSSIAKNKNNIFGLNAVDSSPGESANYFANVEQCINEFAYNWMSTGYLDTVDSRYRGPHLGDKHSGINVKYASDPYWGEKAASQPYYIDTSKTDYGRYTIGIATKTEIPFYVEPTTSSKRVYTSGAVGSGTKAYMYDFPVCILEKVKGSDGKEWYKVQSDVALKSDRSNKDVNAKYNYSRDYVYIKASDIDIVFTGNNKIDTSPTTPTVKPDEVIKSLGLTKSKTYLTGFSLGSSVNTIINKAKQIQGVTDIKIYDLSDKSITDGIISTNMTMKITATGGTQEYTIVIRGDISCDGKISALDYVKLRNYLDSKSTLNNGQKEAADTSDDGKISALDYVKIRNHLDEKSTIKQ